MKQPIINPRTKRHLSDKAASILRLMAGASFYEGEREWPILGVNFGANSASILALDTMERAGLIERAKPATRHDDWATHRNYRITDAARTLLAGELAENKARAEQFSAERRAENLRQEQERRNADDLYRRMEAQAAVFPELLLMASRLAFFAEQHALDEATLGYAERVRQIVKSIDEVPR
jgi:hypothetical protein